MLSAPRRTLRELEVNQGGSKQNRHHGSDFPTLPAGGKTMTIASQAALPRTAAQPSGAMYSYWRWAVPVAIAA